MYRTDDKRAKLTGTHLECAVRVRFTEAEDRAIARLAQRYTRGAKAPWIRLCALVGQEALAQCAIEQVRALTEATQLDHDTLARLVVQLQFNPSNDERYPTGTHILEEAPMSMHDPQTPTFIDNPAQRKALDQAIQHSVDLALQAEALRAKGDQTGWHQHMAAYHQNEADVIAQRPRYPDDLATQLRAKASIAYHERHAAIHLQQSAA